MTENQSYTEAEGAEAFCKSLDRVIARLRRGRVRELIAEDQALMDRLNYTPPTNPVKKLTATKVAGSPEKFVDACKKHEYQPETWTVLPLPVMTLCFSSEEDAAFARMVL